MIRKEAVDMIGAPMLNMINNMPEKGGHSNIDSLIEKATMSNMKGMYGGGMVQAGPKPMGTGGMVDAYAGGGMVMDQYGHGGKVKKNLKPVPKNNPGLGKLPEAVRNKMGYMQEGGEVQDSKPMMEFFMRNFQDPRKKDLKGSVMSGELEPREALQMLLNMQMADRLRATGDTTNVLFDRLKEAGYEEGGEVQDSLMGMMYGGMANKKKKGYQEGGMIGPTLPPEMMGQAMNQQLSDSIDMRMQNPQAGGSIGVARDQAMALQDSINMNTVDSARKSLQLLRLQSLLSEGGDTLNFEGSMMPPNQEMESARARDLLEFLKMQTMQRGMGSVRQGMGDEPMRALR